MEETYNTICDEVSEFTEFDKKDFLEIMTLIHSRIITVQVDEETDMKCLVPFADMLNHRQPK